MSEKRNLTKEAPNSRSAEMQLEAHSPRSGKYLSVRHLAQRYSTSVATVWRWARERSDFPKPVKLSPSCTRWKEADLAAFEARLEGSE
jgi:prophage regulatory protein